MILYKYVNSSLSLHHKVCISNLENIQIDAITYGCTWTHFTIWTFELDSSSYIVTICCTTACIVIFHYSSSSLPHPLLQFQSTSSSAPVPIYLIHYSSSNLPHPLLQFQSTASITLLPVYLIHYSSPEDFYFPVSLLLFLYIFFN